VRIRTGGPPPGSADAPCGGVRRAAPGPAGACAGVILGHMKLNRPLSWFLVAFGVWSWIIWITFAKNLWADGEGLAFDKAGHPLPYFWIHLSLAVVSFLLGTAIGVLGLRSLRVLRSEGRGGGSAPVGSTGPSGAAGDRERERA
jgi:hypothetical protein